MRDHPLIVVGIGPDGAAGLSAEARGHVTTARVLAGGHRHLDYFPEWGGTRIPLGSDVEEFVDRLRACYTAEKTVVLASGDPLFYGIGGALLRAIPRENLVFLPQVSSVQLAFARVKETWHDARVVSLHGRPLECLRPALLAREAKIAVLTDGINHPGAIAEWLRELGVAEEYALWVCENLGGPDERVSLHPAGRLSGETFSPLNVVVLVREVGTPGRKRQQHEALPLLGLPEGQLLHRAGPRGLITRREVRLLALCSLELHPGDVLWDVGAGSGSVALEAARLSPELQVFALERDAEEYRRLEANTVALGLGRVRAIHAEAPHGTADLPDPDAVFVGGNGGRLLDILDMALSRLRPNGRLVLNCIALETLSGAWEWLRSRGLEPDVTSVQLAHSRPLGCLHALEPDNLIFILRVRKP